MSTAPEQRTQQGSPTRSVPARSVVVRPCGDGPLLVRGADVVEDADGTAHPVTRPVVAVCTCEKSQRLPWCDGTHKAVARARRRRAATGS